MENFEILILVLMLVIALLAVADKFKLPHSVLLVLSGLAIAFVPSIPEVTLNPEVVFFLFLPPILYDAASNTSWHEFKAEAWPISTLAIALVFFTTVVVAISAHFLIPGFPWPLGFLLGAIVSPPDAVATTSITKGLGLNRRVTTILEGESLVNDASALIAYRLSIAAIGTGSFVYWKAGLNFLFISCGGIAIGVMIGFLVIFIQKKIFNNSIISTSLTLITPFVAYLFAERIHTSGVLAVVTTGLMMSWRTSDVYSYQTRIRNKAVWDTLIFLLNGFVFILIGLQLRNIIQDLETYSVSQLIVYGLIVSIVTIVIRIVWVFTASFSPLIRNSSGKREDDSDTWKNVMIVAWTGTRGIVSLATALALPLTLADGSAFPHRSLILFLAFVVIFVTLVVQGLSLPLLIKFLRLKNVYSQEDEERKLRVYIASQVVNFIDVNFPYELDDDIKNELKSRYRVLIQTFSSDKDKSKQRLPVVSEFLKAQPEIQKFERELLSQLYKGGSFNQATIRRVELELDLAEQQFKRITKGKR
jgi:monovalent cation/hydrogen antiporter